MDAVKVVKNVRLDDFEVGPDGAGGVRPGQESEGVAVRDDDGAGRSTGRPVA